ncbi:MAG: protein-export membrane protein SecF [Candidatus Wildermuthbacteria bacterium GWA2_46_15]|uniref:Protein-export membrane protein SecF n=1 Tax=Candidatus Wildermuthbacteria bacterium GWA2_46_15 TaxID=1802443 RepID=A0A1G2QPT3_9BACT|nr:MAG: protein-export membrane protein SecF [Candidatus Wildermuthbacteria bacterium GWA2_46_15]
MVINFVKYRKLYYLFSGILILASLFSIFKFGLKMGIEFTGGSLVELKFDQARLTNQAIAEKLAKLNLGEIIVQPTGENGVFLRFKEVDEATHQEILKELGQPQEMSFETIGPTIGRELERKTLLAVFLALIAITAYVALAFRQVSGRVNSFQYGLASLIALFHDVLIPIGAFALLGHFYNLEITIAFVAALLTVLGFSVHDTIVVFDRVRENLLKRSSLSFEEVVNLSLNQTLVRSINTVLTVLFTLLSIYFFGGETLRGFALSLIIGVTSGAYSSIFIASPLLVSWQKR